MKYRQAINYLESFQKFGVRLGLDRIKLLLSKLGNPQDTFKSIHIAGTNGKGSVAAMLSSILTKAGYKVGLYTSPHLVDYTERIRVNEKDVSREKFAEAVTQVKNKLMELPGLKLTEFEVLTAAAFLLLSQEKMDIAVIEVGLGGRLDATNVITPVLSIITSVDLDHTDVLGNSLVKIAKEKAGIIKRGIPLVTGENRSIEVLRGICKKKSSPFISAGKIKIKYHPLAGVHQIENTKIVMAGIDVLKQKGFKVNARQIYQGLRKTRWSGRIQVVHKKPLIILDGAHNPAGAKALRKYLSSLKKKITFIVGMQKNKAIPEFIDIVRPLAEEFIVVRSSNPGAAPKEMFGNKIKGPVFAKNIRQAFIYAKQKKHPVCVTGSLYLVGDVLRQKLIDL